LEQFSKGDLVYVHDPTHKRNKAKKFSYQYKGPFEVEQKISPLIYKVRSADRTFAIIHINRLKRAYGQMEGGRASPVKGKSSTTVKLDRFKKIIHKEGADLAETGKLDVEIPPHSQVVDRENKESSEAEEDVDNLPLDRGKDSE